jgi:hypothetical protein
MTRAASGDTVTLRPTANIYTALAAAGTVAAAIGLAVLIIRGNTMTGGLWSLWAM